MVMRISYQIIIGFLAHLDLDLHFGYVIWDHKPNTKAQPYQAVNEVSPNIVEALLIMDKFQDTMS
jgi:hypothetical protein